MTTATPNSSAHPTRRRLLAGLGLSGAAAGLAAWAGAAVAMEHGSPHGHHGMGFGPAGPGMEQRMGERVKRLFRKVGASDTQQVRATTLLDAAAQEMKTLHEAHRNDRELMLRLLSAETLDRVQIETQRQRLMAHADAVSQRMIATGTELAEVLTPAQRRAAAEHLLRWQSHRRPA